MNRLIVAAYNWQKTKAQNLKIGSRFRLENAVKSGDVEVFVILEMDMIGKCSLSVYSQKWISDISSESPLQHLSLEKSDIVFVIPSHEETIVLNGPGNV